MAVSTGMGRSNVQGPTLIGADGDCAGKVYIKATLDPRTASFSMMLLPAMTRAELETLMRTLNHLVLVVGKELRHRPGGG